MASPADYNDPIFKTASSPRQISEYLKIDKTFLYSQIRKGRLKVRELSPKCLRILPQDLIRWLETTSRTPAAAEAEPKKAA